MVLGVLRNTDGSTESAIARSMAITDTKWAKCHHLWSETAIPVKRRIKTAMRYVQKFVYGSITGDLPDHEGTIHPLMATSNK